MTRGATAEEGGRSLFGTPSLLMAEALFLAVLAHLALASLFKPVEKRAQPSQEAKRFTVMAGPRELAKDDPCGLLYWLKYGDPALFAKPERAVSPHSKTQGRDAAPEDLPLEENDKFALLRPGQFDLKCEERALAMLLPADWLRAGTPRYKQDKPLLPPKYPIWLDSSGRFIPSVSIDDPDASRLAGLFKPQSDTVLLAIDGGEDLPPEIRVMDSCGAKALDSIAARTLASRMDIVLERGFSQDGKALFSVRWNGGEGRRASK